MLTPVRAPLNPSDPAYDPDLPEPLVLIDQEKYFVMNPVTGTFAPPLGFPEALKLDENSAVSIFQLGTSAPSLYFTGSRGALYVYDLAADVTRESRINVRVVESIAASGDGHLSVIADGYGYSVDPETGDLSVVFTTDSGTELGEFSLETHFQAYGTNGLLYVLDYGNDRVQMLDPANGFNSVGEFALEEEVTVANIQFAIGSNGNVYLGDGLGGGSAYDEDGTFIGAFAPIDSEDVVMRPKDAFYLTNDKDGNVYVIDGAGLHQYHDASVVPEPATWVLLILGGAGCFALVRRRARVSG